MSELKVVNMGDLLIGQAPLILTTGGLGSCVALCLYSPVNKSGALAHVMLSKSPDGTNFDQSNSRYADIAMAIILDNFQKQGIQSHQLTAKIIGGANMFPDIQGRSQKVGEKNISSIKELLQTFSIRLEAEETGGHTGRAVSFDLSNGIVTITMTL